MGGSIFYSNITEKRQILERFLLISYQWNVINADLPCMEFYWSMLNKFFIRLHKLGAPGWRSSSRYNAILSSITREFPAFLTVTAPHLSERQCWVNNDGKQSQQMPASHWPVSAILASDWPLDMTHTPRTLTPRWAGLVKEREREELRRFWRQNWERMSCSST